MQQVAPLCGFISPTQGQIRQSLREKDPIVGHVLQETLHLQTFMITTYYFVYFCLFIGNLGHTLTLKLKH